MPFYRIHCRQKAIGSVNFPVRQNHNLTRALIRPGIAGAALPGGCVAPARTLRKRQWSDMPLPLIARPGSLQTHFLEK